MPRQPCIICPALGGWERREGRIERLWFASQFTLVDELYAETQTVNDE